VNRTEIARTEEIIRPYIRRTPVIEMAGADIGIETRSLCLKLEFLQHSGSFKARGAFANLLTRKIPASGVVAASGGNHGAAVAYAAMKLNVAAKIFVPTVSSPAKLRRIREYGADLTVEGDRYADALAASQAFARQSGALPVHAFDQEETMLGQGSIGMEMEVQAPDIDTLLVAVGGGGLIAGIAAWYAGRIKVVGVEPFAAPTLTKALQAGRPVDAEAGGLAADSLAPRRIGDRVFPTPKNTFKAPCWSPTKRSCRRRTCFGRRCELPPNPAALRRSPQYCPALTSRCLRNALPSSSAAAIPPPLILPADIGADPANRLPMRAAAGCTI
jgi:threonine dehydratase